MTPRQKSLVRRSWARIRDRPESVGALFYQRLFTINPNTRRLFGSKDMHLQGTLFMQMLAMFMRGLDDDDPAIAAAIAACGRRHIGYGVTYSDYEPVGEAFLWALEDSLGPHFGPEVREAWAEAYRSLAAQMRLGSSSVL